jgi:transcription antitermination factor NusG
MWKKLFNRFKGGKKCEEKNKFKFKYGDSVKVVSGFYEGCKGKVIHSYTPERYMVSDPDGVVVWFDDTELEKV